MADNNDITDATSVDTSVSTEEVEVSTEESTSGIEVHESSDSFDALATEIKSLREAVAKAETRKQDNKRASDDREKIEKMSAEVERLNADLTKQQNATVARKAEYDVSEDTIPSYSTKDFKQIVTMQATPGSDFEQIQKCNDELYIAATLLGTRNPMEVGSINDYVQRNYPMVSKAMDTTATTGAEWIPTGFSSKLVEDVRLQLRVAALHSRFEMPTNPFVLPVEGADATAYLASEITGDDDELTAGNRVTPSTPGTQNVTFTASKIGVRVVTSTEIQEDSIIAILPYVRDKIAIAMAESQENTVINGDTSAVMDTLVAGDQRRAYNGWRQHAATAGTTVNLATLNIANIRTMRAGMGKYGVNNSRLAYVCGINLFNNLLSLQDAGGNDIVTSMDKFGPHATILSGQLGAIDGIPLIISEFVSDTLDAVGNDGLVGSGNSKTELLLCRTDAFRFGDRRMITLKSREVIETDHNVLVALQRLDMQGIYPSATVVSAGVNVALI